MEEEDKGDISILMNDIVLRQKSETDARSFIEKANIRFKQAPSVSNDRVRKIESVDITKFKHFHGNEK